MENRLLINDFLEMLSAERGASPITIDAYRRDVEQFWAECKKAVPAAVVRSDISDFIAFLNKENYTTKSIARKISSLREYFKFLYSEKEIMDNQKSDPRPVGRRIIYIDKCTGSGECVDACS